MTLSRLAPIAFRLLPSAAHAQILGFTPAHATIASLPSAPPAQTLGFTPAPATRKTAVEEKFKSIPTPDEERRQPRIFTFEPHVAGSKRNNELADYIASEW